jgi:hypothetical protein
MGKEIVIKTGFKGTTIIFFIFLALKLSNIIDWSWWWVTCPLWLGWAMIGAFFLIFLLIIFLAALISK